MGLTPGTRLGQYEILAPLGAGGMGEVYRARDTRLGREVAIKILTGRLTPESGMSRFEREARLLASLNHPGIAAVYGLEEAEGMPFIVMELVPGETLSERLYAGPLPIPEALDVARQIAEALESAHEHGVVHRDLKPGNVKVTPEGRVKVLDLGLAKAFDMKSSDEMSKSPTMALDQTRPGVILGTAEFMSPEQARGKAVDKRTDIWAFGCVLYEMLTGRRAFTGETLSDVLAAILTTEPDWDALPPATPPRVRELLGRCLEKSPNRRLRDIGEARIAMEEEVGVRPSVSSGSGSRPRPAARAPSRRRPALAVAAVAAVLLAGLWIWNARRSESAPAAAERTDGRYLAVLFTDLSGMPRAQMYSDGLAETVRARLERFPSVQVTPPSADVPRSRAEADLLRMARSLGANILLRGSIQRLGEQVRVTYSLVEVPEGNQIASGTVDGAASEIFAIQDQLADRVRVALDLRGETPPAGGLVRAALEPAASRESYAEALGYLQRYDKEASVDSALEILEKLAKDAPESALVQAALARGYLHKYTLTQQTGWAEQAMKASDRATALDPALAEVHITRGQLFSRTGKPASALQEFQKALSQSARSVEALLGMAAAYGASGSPAEAEKAYRQAISLRPLGWNVYNQAGGFYYRQGKYPEAVAMFQKVVQLMPDSVRGYNNLGAVYKQMGLFDKAQQALESSARIEPNDGAYMNLGNLEYYRGRYRESVKAFEEAARIGPAKPLNWANLGDAYRWAPDLRPRSLEAYRKAIALGQQQLAINPRDAGLHATLALSYAKSGELPAARRHMERALEIEPNNPDIFVQAAVVANLDEKPDEAVRWIGRAIAGGIGADQVKTEPEFQNLRDLPAFREALTRKAAV
jgi:serine/threonine-protein kinase